MNRIESRTRCTCSVALLLGVTMTGCSARAQERSAAGTIEWRAYASNNASSKYSPADQINKQNVRTLRIAWRQSATPPEARRGLRAVTIPSNFEVTPIMIGGLLYTTTGVNTVAALDPTTGKVV